MHIALIAMPDAELPQSVNPVLQHVLRTSVREANQTVSMLLAVPVILGLSGDVEWGEADPTCSLEAAEHGA